MAEDSFRLEDRWGGQYCPKTFLTFQGDTSRLLKKFSDQHRMCSLVSPPRYHHASECSILHQKSVSCHGRAADLHRKLKGMVWTWVLDGPSFGDGIHHLGGAVAVTHSGIHILHVSLGTPLNWASAEDQTH